MEKKLKAEIDLLPINVKFYYSINYLKDELIIHKREFKILPKLKFVRGKDKIIIISDKVAERHHITIPYTIKKEIVFIDCTKFHNDYVEREVEKKAYNDSIKAFVKEKLDDITAIKPIK